MSFLGSLMRDDEEEKRLPHGGQIAVLRDALPRFTNPPRFEVGDLVTPHANATVRNAGEPHIVLEHGPDAPMFVGAPGANHFGKHLSMRVAVVTSDGDVATFWVEPAEFTHYIEKDS